MGTHRHILNTLRSIALDYASTAHPDLALMARELGRVVHQGAPSLSSGLASLRTRQHGFERVLLTRRSKPALSIWVVAWPPNHVSPLQEHAGTWGLELALVGALEVQSAQRDATSGEVTVRDRTWLGPGDSAWFDGEAHQLRRCRNLSRQETALSLHVHGGELSGYLAPERGKATTALVAPPRRNTLASRLHG